MPGLKQNLVLKLKQEQRLTQKLIQKLELIPMTNVELEVLIENELMLNEFLKADISSSKSEKEQDKDDSPEKDELSETLDVDADLLYSQKEWEDIKKKHKKSRVEGGKSDFLENIADSAANDFKKHIRSELILLNLDKRENEIAEYVVELLDNKGFLPYDNEMLSNLVIKKGEDLDNISERVGIILEKIKNIEPYGISCIDFKEYLNLLYEKKELDDVVLHDIINIYLDDISKNRLSFVATRLKVDVEVIKEKLQILKDRFQPYPSFGFDVEEIDYIKPDATILDDGEIIIHSAYSNIRVLDKEKFEKKIKKYKDKDTINFLKNQFNKAKELAENFYSRNSLLHDILEKIYNRQESFFSGGSLVPLKQIEIADMLGVNVSTISRGVSGKYVRTARGIYRIGDFFVNASTGDISSDQAMTKIKDIIEKENTKKPLSDDAIAKILKNDYNIDIKRRTVTKYREKMNIGSSRERKEY